MQIIKLTKDQVSKIYEEHMVNDFPASERKPLRMLLTGMDKGSYICLGITRDEYSEANGIKDLAGYAYFYNLNNTYLFDYLAVFDGERNNGIGSIALGLLKEYFKDSDCIIGESEDPDFAKDEKERTLMEHRIGFYKRNGLRDTTLRVKLFGVRFIVLQFAGKRQISKEEARDLYKAIYKSMLPLWLYMCNIRTYR